MHSHLASGTANLIASMPRRSTVGERTLTLNRAESVTLRLADMLDVNYSRVSDLFRAWDTNGDGKISRTEFRRAMEFLKLPSTDAEIDELFDKFDRDGSGSLNFKELQKEIQLARKRASSPSRPLQLGAPRGGLIPWGRPHRGSAAAGRCWLCSPRTRPGPCVGRS